MYLSSAAARLVSPRPLLPGLKGFDVVVADAAQPPIDKACGEGLMPDSIDAAAPLGHRARIPSNRSFFVAFVLSARAARVAADFPRIPGIAVRRSALHQLLIDRAEALGVKLLWRTRSAESDEIRARWIMGADGPNSRVRRWAGLDLPRSQSLRYGFRRHFRLAPWIGVHGDLLGGRAARCTSRRCRRTKPAWRSSRAIRICAWMPHCRVFPTWHEG